MPAPVSPITDLWNRLRTTQALKGVPLLLGAKKYAEGRSPNSIVMFPVKGSILPFKASGKSIRVVDLAFVVHCWGAGGSSAAMGADFDAAWYLGQQFIQALGEQAAGEQAMVDGSNPGWFWEANLEAWDTSFDTSRQGEAVEITFVATHFPINAAAGSRGHVSQVSIASSTGAPPTITIP